MFTPRKIRINVEIEGYSPRAGGFVQYRMIVTNISLTGCFIKTDQSLEIDAPVSFDLPLTNEETLQLDGKVVREQYEPRGYGINFAPMNKDHKRELAMLIADSEED